MGVAGIPRALADHEPKEVATAFVTETSSKAKKVRPPKQVSIFRSLLLLLHVSLHQKIPVSHFRRVSQSPKHPLVLTAPRTFVAEKLEHSHFDANASTSIGISGNTYLVDAEQLRLF